MVIRYCSKEKKLPFIEVEANGILEITVTSIFAWAVLLAKAACYTLAGTLRELLVPAFEKDPLSVQCAEHSPILYKIHWKTGYLAPIFVRAVDTNTNQLCLQAPSLQKVQTLKEPWLRILGIQSFCCQTLSHLTSNAPLLTWQLMCLSLKLALGTFQQVKFDSTNVHIQWAL